MVALGGQVQGDGRSCRCQLQLPVARSVGAIVQRVYQISDCEVLCPNQKLFFFLIEKNFQGCAAEPVENHGKTLAGKLSQG